jgi:ankyrin repeat protein
VSLAISLDHRRLLDHAPGFRPFRGTDLFSRIGGQPTVDKLVDALYDGFEDDEVLRPMRHGARADDRRDGDATALHYAAKAGFLRTVKLLLQHGADPKARDNKGRTPFDWLDDSAKSVDRNAVRRLFTTLGGTSA